MNDCRLKTKGICKDVCLHITSDCYNKLSVPGFHCPPQFGPNVVCGDRSEGLLGYKEDHAPVLTHQKLKCYPWSVK